jgi:uncharacterized protein YdhG (YjbR/CyaY superfamily)
MLRPGEKFENVDLYIAAFPKHIQERLQEVRAIVQKTAPKAEEVISYNMPAFRLNGMLVFFAGYKAHIGFYPTPSGIKAFEKELKMYVTSKGAIQFPLESKLPVTLIKNIVKFRMAENEEKIKNKK